MQVPLLSVMSLWAPTNLGWLSLWFSPTWSSFHQLLDTCSCLSLMTSSLFLYPVAMCKPLVLSTSSCSLLLFHPKPTKLGQHFHLGLHTALTNAMNYGIFCGFYNTVSTILSFLYFFYDRILLRSASWSRSSSCLGLSSTRLQAGTRETLGKCFSLKGVGHETGR